MIDTTLAKLALNITDGKHGDCRNEEGSGYYFISCKDITDGNIHYENARQITKNDFLDSHKRTLLEPNDILITNSGTIGRMAFVKDNPLTYRTTFQKSVAIVKPDENKISSQYLYYLLQYCVGDFVNQSNGAAQKNLLLSTMRAFKLKYHSDKDTQKRIAGILSAYDDLIENNQKQIKLLEEAAQRLYKEWFVDLRFPGCENTPIIDGVPQGWKTSHLSKIARLSAGGDKPDVFSKVKSSVCNIPVYSNGVTDDGLYGYTDSATVNDDCITVSARGNVGYTCLRRTPFLPIVRLITVIPKRECVEYLYFYLKDMTFKSNGAAQQQITVPMIKDEEIVLPCNKLLWAFKEKEAPIFDLVDHLKMKITICKEARDRLLPKLMSGELEV